MQPKLPRKSETEMEPYVGGPAGAGKLFGIYGPGEGRLPTDHRRDYRHFDAVEQAVVTFRGKQKSVRVLNISERGVMIKGRLHAEVGEPIAVKFDGFARMRGIVRWVKERCIGVDLS
jgi:hypothetical protein